MSIIKLSREAFFHNLDIIAQKVGGVSKVAIVLKDNAYGHGLLEMATLAKEYGLTEAVVHTLVEAQAIYDYFDRILILGRQEVLVDAKFHYTINTLEQIKEMPAGALVELKVDTGMHRNGVAMDEVTEALSLIDQQALELRGLFSHHRSADTLSSEWFFQNQNFEKVKQMVQVSRISSKIRFHMSNSAGTFRNVDCSEDLVRVGIAAYGLLEMDETLEQPDLKPVLSLHAQKIATRTLKQGERLGYNATFRADEDIIVTTYDLGYAMGLLRSASNDYVAPCGAKQLGRISMDNVSFSGDQAMLEIFKSAADYAKVAGTISYEVLTSLSPALKREVF